MCHGTAVDGIFKAAMLEIIIAVSNIIHRVY